MSRENGFENKRVVIIGGSSGIGLAVAEEATSQGAEVVIISSNAERVQEAIQSIRGEARGQAVELAPIRVNAVSPGVVRTNLWQNMNSAEREQLFESVGKRLPVGRVGEAHDLAQAYLFLMKEEFATGQTVVVDGGTVLV